MRRNGQGCAHEHFASGGENCDLCVDDNQREREIERDRDREREREHFMRMNKSYLDTHTVVRIRPTKANQGKPRQTKKTKANPGKPRQTHSWQQEPKQRRERLGGPPQASGSRSRPLAPRAKGEPRTAIPTRGCAPPLSAADPTPW